MEPPRSSPPAGLPPPLPATPAPASAATRWLLIIAASLTALVAGLLTLLLLGLSTGPVGLVFGIVLAVVPVPVYMLLVLWLDRFEKEPLWMLATAFVWGATVALFFAYILNTTFGVIVAGALGEHADVATAIISAPFVEELAKGFALLIFYFWKRDEFDNVLDGIIYAAMVGLGFAMTENILYYGNALAAEGLGGSIFTFILRGVVSPFAHPLFTSMTGIGLGLAQQAPRGSPVRFFAPLAGICLAMFVHFLWNLSASLGAMFFVAYASIMFPAFLGLITIVLISLRKEGRIIREQLMPELRSGLLAAGEHAALSTVSGRIGGAWRALKSGGRAQWKARMRMHDAASELAFHRWRTARGILPRRETASAREARYLAQLHALLRQLGLTAAVPPAVAIPPVVAGPPIGKVARAPRSGGSRGVVIAIGSLGCLGLLALAVVVLALALIGASETASAPTPVAQTEEALEAGDLADLLPEQIGALALQDTVEPDIDTTSMFGATEGVRGDYASNMSVLLLRYRTPELAASALEPLRTAMFPESDGWKVQPSKQAQAESISVRRNRTRTASVLTQRGSIVMIFSGDAAHIAQFAVPDQVLPKTTAP